MMPYPTLGLHTPRGVCVLCVSSKGGLHRVHGAPDVASKEKKKKGTISMHYCFRLHVKDS